MREFREIMRNNPHLKELLWSETFSHDGLHALSFVFKLPARVLDVVPSITKLHQSRKEVL